MIVQEQATTDKKLPLTDAHPPGQTPALPLPYFSPRPSGSSWTHSHCSRCYTISPTIVPIANMILMYIALPQLPYYLTHYVHGTTPLSTYPVVVGILVGYLATAIGICEIMKTHQPQRLNFLIQLHSAFSVPVVHFSLCSCLRRLYPSTGGMGFFMCCITLGHELRSVTSHSQNSNNWTICMQCMELYFLALKKIPFGL